MHPSAHLALAFTRLGFQDVEFFKYPHAFLQTWHTAQMQRTEIRNYNWNSNRVSFLAPNETLDPECQELLIFFVDRYIFYCQRSLGWPWSASGFIALTNTMQLSGQKTHEELWPGPGPNDLWRVFNYRADSWGPNNGVFTRPSDVFRPDMCVCFLLLAPPPRQVEGFNCPPLRCSLSAPSLDVWSHSLLTPLGPCLQSL